MTLQDLGYTNYLEKFRIEHHLDSFQVGRVISEHKERYVVKTESGEFDSELIGHLRFTAESRHDFPAVGDWVAITEYDDDKALIHAIYPRSSIIERTAVGKIGQKQIIATNIDFGLIVQAVDRDFNINRLERYLTICYDSKVKPVIILNKIDLVSETELSSILDQITSRIRGVPTFPISNLTLAGYDALTTIIKPGETYCLLGSSGVGKSTFINAISGKEQMKTGEISTSSSKGRHVTSHRELIVLENGGIFIDNPGMREVGIADADSGLEMTFDEIVKLSENCRYSDCTHLHEKGCAVLESLENEDLDQASYDNYVKMLKEKEHYESTVEEKRKKDKQFGKMIKAHKKNRKHNKY
jgi:ribosome biogenesis GTPase